jgi:hypothetical protein
LTNVIQSPAPCRQAEWMYGYVELNTLRIASGLLSAGFLGELPGRTGT